jgi:hypothetical protein
MLRDSVKADLRKTSDLRHPISIIVRRKQCLISILWNLKEIIGN